MRSHGCRGWKETKEKPGSLHKLSPRTPAHPPGLSSQGPSALMEQLRPPVPPASASKPPAGPSWAGTCLHLSPPPASARPVLPAADRSPGASHPPTWVFFPSRGLVYFIYFWFCFACSLSPEYPANPFSISCWDLPSNSGKLVPISTIVNPWAPGPSPGAGLGEGKQERGSERWHRLLAPWAALAHSCAGQLWPRRPRLTGRRRVAWAPPSWEGASHPGLSPSS